MNPLLLIALVCVALAGCGSDDTPSREEAAEQAKDLAQQTRELADEVARSCLLYTSPSPRDRS